MERGVGFTWLAEQQIQPALRSYHVPIDFRGQFSNWQGFTCSALVLSMLVFKVTYFVIIVRYLLSIFVVNLVCGN